MQVVAVAGLPEFDDTMDLVAVLHRHTGFLDGLFHGSVAKRLALQARIPLLVLEH